MSFLPRRKPKPAPAMAKTTVEAPREGGISMRDFYHDPFENPRAALTAPDQSTPENAMTRFYRELNAKPKQSDADGKQGKDVLMAANEEGQNAGQNTTNSTLAYPTADPYVTSPYGWRRHPITHKKNFHSATDYRNEKGNPVFSSRSGKVIAKGKDSNGTNFVKIRDKDGVVFGYFHTDSNLNIGDIVNMADEIGLSDDSGQATGTHLHLTVEPKGTRESRVDPDQFLRDNKAGKVKRKK